MKPICIIGHSRHGKDAAAAALHYHGELRHCGSTSWHALPLISEDLRLTEQNAWETRHEKRQWWKDWCDEFRREDPLRLVRLALKKGNIVSGIRDRVEIEAARKERIFDSILWIVRPGFPDDPTLTFDPAEYFTDVIQNDGTLEELRERVLGWAQVKKYIQK